MDSNGYGAGFGDLGPTEGGILVCYLLFVFGAFVFMVWLYWRILTKAGYSGWLALLNLIPLGTFILTLILAFGNWPALQNRGGYAPTYQPSSAQPPVYPPQAPQQAYQPPVAPTYQQPAPPAPPAPPLAPPTDAPTPGGEPPAPPA